MTCVFVDRIDLTQTVSNQALVARQSRLKPVLKDISAAIWSLPLLIEAEKLQDIQIEGKPSGVRTGTRAL